MSDAVLLDTHILLWARIEPARLTASERKAIDQAPRRYVSVATLWEIAILMSLDRLGRDERLLDVPDAFALLPILPEHVMALLELPYYHRDPFDRMLVAQARAEGLTLLSRDKAVARYAKEK